MKFLQDIYEHHPLRVDTPPHPGDIDQHPERYFDAELVVLMHENARLTQGYVGALEADPFCNCQDGPFEDKIVLVSVTPTKAQAIATIRFPKSSPPFGPFDLTFDLVMTPGGWRIHDIHSKQTPSVRGLLIQSNREAAEAPAS